MGERFGVRNAGCRAVIEGTGDHLGERLGRPSVKRGGKRPVAEAGCIGTGEETGVTRCFKNATADEGKKDRQTQWSRFCQWRPDLVLRPRYMTNGVIVALGRVGRNVAAGMSGGLLYIYEERMGGREGRNLSMLHAMWTLDQQPPICFQFQWVDY